MTIPHTHYPLPNLEAIRALHFTEDGESLRVLGARPVTYFEAFGLPVRLQVDVEKLRDAFLDLSRRIHPDFYATKGELLREESLRRSSLLNNAHKALRDPQKRAEYLISLYGIGIDSSKNAAPPEMLEEMFDIQEAGEELKAARLSGDGAALTAAEGRVAPLREEIRGARAKLQEMLTEQFSKFDTQLDTNPDITAAEAQQWLRAIRVTLDRMNYLRTVIRNLS
ncbi:hypothetical protein BH09SUM1_BH09SUM1_23560 [soil metagenome]